MLLQTDGGYLGSNFATFLSAVIARAPGTYMVTVTENQDVVSPFSCTAGQTVIVSGDRALEAAPTWGSGGFMVGESASLTLSYLQVDTVIQMDQGALDLILDSCLLTFSDALVLRVETASFLQQSFLGGIVVPADARKDDAAVSIADSTLTFGPTVEMAVTVQNGARLYLSGSTLISSTTLATSDNANTLLIRVDDGGQIAVQGNTLARADGSSDPFPCDGNLAAQTCSSPHVDQASIDGPIEIRANSPLVCTESGCFTISCPELTYSASGHGSESGIVSYDNSARIYTASFQTTATYSCSGGRPAPLLAGGSATRTCQIDGTWGDEGPEQPCLPCCSTSPRPSGSECGQCSSGCQHCGSCTSYALWNSQPHGSEDICPYCCRGWCDGSC